MAKASRAYKGAGRPPGSPNVATGMPRDTSRTFKWSAGALATIKALSEVIEESQADVVHQAVREMAIRKLSTPQHVALIKTI